MRLALPKGHRLARTEQVTLEDLADEAWVQTSEASACARHVVRICRAAGFEPRVSFESDDYLTVQGLVAAGVGVALIPELALSQTVSYDIAVRELHPAGPGQARGRGDARKRRLPARCRRDAGHPAGHRAPLPAVTIRPPPPPCGGGGGAQRRKDRGAIRPALQTDTPATGRPRGRPRDRGRRCRPSSRSASSMRSGTNSPTSFSRMNVPIAEKPITHRPVTSLVLEQFGSCRR